MSFKAKKGINKHRSHTVDEAIVEVTKDEIVGLNINIPKQKRAKFKAITALNGDTMNNVVIEAINNYLIKNG